ncbi:MAG: HAD hydrolase-like protein, partial [Anaerolineales bacterium]|nr:HAD hydrolase-like protein [Anaerolineales bacterium]
TWLNAHSFPYVLFSNNSTRPFREHVDHLAGLGLPVPAASILTAARVTAAVLAAESPGALCLAVGEAGLSEALQAAGLDLLQDWADSRLEHGGVKYVVVGLDREFNYEKLRVATRALRMGAELISSNPDLLYPNGNELIPASGVIQAALEAAGGVTARVIGKPELAGFRQALQILGCSPHQVAMLGDQLGTDILGAKRAGLRTFLVLSSITPFFDPHAAPVQPDGVTPSTLDFFQQWVRQKE